jgi:2-dehydropantoate 2-reductase
MKILIFGAGVIGTLHAWALAKAGNDVSLLVRPGKEQQWANGIQLDLIDNRGGKQITVKEKFTPHIVTDFSASDGYELVVQSVKHTQSEQVIQHIAPKLGDSILLFFNNNWRGLDFIDAALPKTKYVLGLPRAGGMMHNGVLDGALVGEVILGDSICGAKGSSEIEDIARANLQKVAQVFEHAGFKPLLQANMEQFAMVHFATTTAWIAGGAKARGFEGFAKNRGIIRDALAAGQDAMSVCKARGADVTQVQDAQPFLLPPFISAFITQRVLQTPLTMKISAGHGNYAPEELKQIFYDVVETGKQLNVSMPHLLAMEPFVKEIQQT